MTYPDLPKALGGQTAGISHGALLVIGGSYFEGSLFEGGRKVFANTIYALEPKASSWRDVSQLDHPLAYSASVSIDDAVIIIGGSDGVKHYSDVMRLEWKNSKIDKKSLPPLPLPLANMGAANIGKRIFVIGGTTAIDSTEPSNKVYALDLSATESKWSEISSIPGSARILPAVASNNDSIFVASGAELYKGEDGKVARRYLTDAWKYSNDKGWIPIADLPKATVAAPAITVNDSRMLIFGGDDGANASRVFELKDNHPGFQRNIMAYDLSSGEWSKVGELPVSLVTTKAVKLNDSIIITGGEDRPGHRSSRVLTHNIK